MSHSHQDTHQTNGTQGGKRLLIVLALNLSITVAQIIGGILAGSLSLIADAAHNGSDAASLGISYIARRISQQKADQKRTFGYKRAEVIGALINLTTLFIIGFYLLWQAVDRFFNPQPVEGMVMLVVGGIAFVEDAISAYLLYKDMEGSLNIKSAFIHMVADTLSTIGVIIGSLLILFFGIQSADPIITVLIAVYVLVHSYKEIRQAIRILMDSAPKDFDFERMIEEVEAMPGVEELHHVHLWQFDEKRFALEAHVVITTQELPEIEQIKQQIKEKLEDDFDIAHTTLEIEMEASQDHNRAVIREE